MNTAYLSLGTNIHPEANLMAAIRMLAAQTELIAISSVWETQPIGRRDQPDFLNAATIIKTELSAARLKKEILTRIEEQLGRVRHLDKNAPRPMDIDIMLFNRQILRVGHRRIPDKEILERAFVAIPLAEIAPYYHHPETGQTLQTIAKKFTITTNEMRLRPDISHRLQQIKHQAELSMYVRK